MSDNSNPLISSDLAVQTSAQPAPAVVPVAAPVPVAASATAPASAPATTSTASTGLLSAANLLDVGLGSLQILAANLGNPAFAAAAGIAEEVVPLIEAAIEKLLQVKGSTTTYGQLESLRFTPKW